MSIEELKKAIEEMKAQGQSEEEIAGAFYLLFRDGKIDVEQLEALVNVLGFELSEEFKAMDPEQQKEAGYEVLDEENSEEVRETENETSQNEEDEESKAMKLLGQDSKKEKDEETSDVAEEDKENEEDEDEEKKAMKFFQ